MFATTPTFTSVTIDAESVGINAANELEPSLFLIVLAVAKGMVILVIIEGGLKLLPVDRAGTVSASSHCGHFRHH